MSYSYLPSLSDDYMDSAIRIEFDPYVPVGEQSSALGWDYLAHYSTREEHALLDSVFVIKLEEGATYDIFSTSHADPFLVRLYDGTGKVIAVDEGELWPDGMGVISQFVPNRTGDFYIDASWDQGWAPEDRYVSLAVYEDLDTITGSVPPITLDPTQGGNGIDTYTVGAALAGYHLELNGQTTKLTKAGQADKTFTSIERFKFDDVWVATDIDGNAGKAYRLYEAAFNRKPDQEGLGYWIDRLDDGASLNTIASEFLTSPEFSRTYGSDLSRDGYIQALYANVLGRAPDQAGADYWAGRLDSGVLNRAQVLANFSESPENQQGVMAAIQQGIQYEAWIA